ncbi:MAG: phenylalanine--tRNA ligase subunit alpha [Blautia sp.]|nr:phenylalanine--tRNA ligase subunit alpha [Blautia sp.]MDY3999787.1 phenylalanine--tRNA ligase subunit alpha [Blautia sp.]
MLNVDEVKKAISEDLKLAENEAQLSEFWKKCLGKGGTIQGLMNGIKQVAKEEKKAYGQTVNEIKNWAQALYDEKKEEIEKQALLKKYEKETIDVTLPVKMRPMGNLHPLTAVKHEMMNVFAGMGFEIFEGPEIEDDDHNFTRLNVLKDHPSRDMQDTFWLTEDLLLRTHTSPGQIRVMDAQKPPIKVLVPGKVFRSDSDATHSPMFSQMEGLVVDKHITLCDLQGMLDEFVKNMFSDAAKTRLRPSYFPFTEPSVEVDVSCFKCGGKGCSLCKGTGWIEVLGGGVVNNKVLENCGIDSSEYSGLAFGIGIERIAMLKYGINHMGKLFENDIDFLKQFKA